MKKKNRKKKIQYIAALLFAVLLTVIVLKLPGFYYDYEDGSLEKQISMEEYNISVTTEGTLEDRINVLQGNDGIVTENTLYTYEGQQKQRIGRQLINTLLEILVYDPADEKAYRAVLDRFLWDTPVMQCIQVSCMKGNDIFSFTLGVYSVDTELLRGFVIYDMETEKILMANIVTNFPEWDWRETQKEHFEENVAAYYKDFYGWDSYKAAVYWDTDIMYFSAFEYQEIYESKTMSELFRTIDKDRQWLYWSYFYPYMHESEIIQD